MVGMYLLAASTKPDAVGQIAHAYIWLFIFTVFIAPAIKLVIEICRIVKESGVTRRKNNIPIRYQESFTPEEESLIRSAYDKLCKDKLGKESLTEEEKEVLRKNGINV
ncbi:MAG: hypothetical protein IKE94_09040 [Aeriscardovia sp.]|nr:hypothetical protein [Aeriscardovia sp.]MBR2755061.1 hypothetical protein [Lachnospiraceae bacterium]MBR7075523.1 hypothetical protein [Lachnospiraceae bacterium]